LIEVIRDPQAGGASVAKRVFDLLLAVTLFVLAMPVMLLVGLAVAITSRGPVLFRQARVGRDGRHFTMYKFRTMQVGAERATGPVLATENDPRVVQR